MAPLADKSSPAEHMLIAFLVNFIYGERDAGRPFPTRIELGQVLFQEFQVAHRQALEDFLPDGVDVYPGSLAGVPVVESTNSGASMLRADGLWAPLPLPTR